ncbi:MAG: ECF-type sigma factor [Acidobacteriota bacterium]
MASSPETPVTRLLHEWQEGDSVAAEELFPAVAGELRRIAGSLFRNERGGHTLQPTAVVNEAFVRLLGLRSMEWRDRQHFYSFAATAMRRVLVDHARQRLAEKRGGEWVRTEIPHSLGSWTDPVDVLALEKALEELQSIDEGRYRLVLLRFYSGLKMDEIGELEGVSTRTVMRRWQVTKAWLRSFFESRRVDEPRS